MKTKTMLQQIGLLVFSTLISLNVNAAAVDDFFGTGNGSGTVSDPYRISTGDQLNAIRLGGGENRSYKLMQDIDLGEWIDAQTSNPDIIANGWEPIDVFRQEFDGNNFKIIDL